MASPTSTYCDYATGNDYKGASFTDGAYTAGTKTLTKAGAFAASQVNHWLYLTSSAGGSIVAGYYKIASIAGAPNAVVLATDAGAGVDATDASCVQAAGTLLLPWRSIQGALDLITRDATNGDQVNVKAGTAQVNQAALTLARYGTPAATEPLVMRGYTASAGDGGIGEINCNGASMFSSAPAGVTLAELYMHNAGNNIVANLASVTLVYKCKVTRGASTPTSKFLVSASVVVGCYVYDAGTTGGGITARSTYGNYVYNCTVGVNATATYASHMNNTIVDCATQGITSAQTNTTVAHNTIYSSSAATGSGIDVSSSYSTIINNIIEGYSGAGGKGIAITSAAVDAMVIGYNAFYNCATPESFVDAAIIDLGNDATLAASPFTNAAGGDFSLNTAVAGAIDGAFPGAWYGPASTTDHADIGAVQNGAGTGGGGAVSISPMRGGL